MAKTIFVSNRLPVSIKVTEDGNDFEITESLGGLATGLKSVHAAGTSLWIGWNGIAEELISPANREKQETELLQRFGCIPVYFPQAVIETFYEGFCNKTLWPLFHYFIDRTQWYGNLWKYYISGQQRFVDVLANHIDPDDTVWIHDYQLMLLPQMLRERYPNITIGFFLHIPFPSSEIFRMIPQRKEILEGILGANLIGFHTYDYARHFLSCARRMLFHENSFGRMILPSHVATVDTFPMGIDYHNFHSTSHSLKKTDEMTTLLEKVSGKKIILSVDRLDYTKGIPERIRAYAKFLELYPEYLGKVHLVIVAAPSRTGVGAYQKLQKEVEELVGHVNGKHAKIGWVPIWFFCRSFSTDELICLYRVADTLLCTPLRDGMNLVVKEYIASRTDLRGTVILSETTGAASELGEALLVNPNDRLAIVEALKTALTMSPEAQIERNKTMQSRIRRYPVQRWASDFLDRLGKERIINEKRKQHVMTAHDIDLLMDSFRHADKRFLFFDYDGTLVPLRQHPMDAVPDSRLLEIIRILAADPRNQVVIISGRKKSEIAGWFDHLPITLSAEHGLWLRMQGGQWEMSMTLDDSWKNELRPVLESFTDRTPGSFIEEKTVGLAWHYRNCEPELSEVRLNELRETLMGYIHNNNLNVLLGSKVLELRDANSSKGHIVKKFLESATTQFVLCMGDDVTDEEMFAVLPETSWSIRIGEQNSAANYNLLSSREVRLLLERLVMAK